MSMICQKVLQTLRAKNKGSLPLLSCINALNIEEKVSQKGRVFVLTVPSLFFKERVEAKVLPLISEELKALSQGPFSIELAVSGKKILLPQPKVKKTPQAPVKKQYAFSSSYTFENFVLGSSNENNLAFFTAKNLAKTPLKNPNSPFFIYGNSGLGKTHLLHSIGNSLNIPSEKIFYLSAERFLHECVSAIREGKMDSFKQKYRKEALVLLIDDIQAIEKAPASQEEFFHAFNSIHEKGGLIVCTCDRPPEALKKMQKRIQTRLLSGIFAQVEPPKMETRIAILQKKAQEKKLSLSFETFSYLAKLSSSSVRELEGFLNKIGMFSSIQKRDLSLSEIKSLFGKNEENSGIKVQEVIKQVALSYELTPAQLCSSQRAKHIVQARRVAIQKVRKSFPHLSLNEIGRFFGGKSHSTILHHLQNKPL